MTRPRTAILGAALLLATAACQGTPGGASNGVGTDCGMNAEQLYNAGGVIVATVTAACEPAPETHLLTMQLNLTARYRGETSTETLASKQSSEIPSAAGLTLTIKHVCLPGTWTLIISASGRSSDGHPFEYSDRKTLAGVMLSECTKR